MDTARTHRLAPLTILLFAAALAVPAAGQQPSPAVDVPDLFGEVIDVRVVNLEVVVTDRSGARVRGLAPEDFELFVDGQETSIDHFTEVFAGEARPGLHAAVPGLESGEEVGTNYLVYVDDNHTRKVHRDPVVRGLIEQLPHLGEKDRMAVVVQSGPRLEMLSSWSRSERELTGALTRLLDGRDFGGSTRSSLYTARSAAVRAGNAGPSDVERELAPAELRNADDLPYFGSPSMLAGVPERIDLELAVSGVVSTLRGFAMPPGRKVMLLLAGDWPLGSFRPEGTTLTTVTELSIMGTMVETANLLGYTLYPVGVGLPNDLWRNITLKAVARETGGRPLYVRASALADAVEDTRSYYWLGFTPTFVGDDARHDIQVRVNVPGLTVRARRGYVDLSRAAELSMSAQSALLFGHETPGAPLRIELGAATRWGLRKMEVPIVVYVPLDELSFLEQAGVETGRVEIRFAVVDSTGSQADIPIIPVTLSGARSAGEYYKFETSLHLRRRPHELLVSVHDPIGERTLNGRVELSFRSTQD